MVTGGTFFKVNYYTHSIMLCKSLQTHQKKGGVLCKRNLVHSRKQDAYKLSGTQSSFSSFKRISRPLCRQDSCSYRQHHSGVIHKEGDMRSGPLCALLWRILTWCTRQQVTLKAQHIPRQLNVVADKLSRLGQTIQIEWSLLPEVFQMICSRWKLQKIDLFGPRFNNNVPLCHRYRIPWPQQWTYSICHGRIWMHTLSPAQPCWAKWWRTCRTPYAGESF